MLQTAEVRRPAPGAHEATLRLHALEVRSLRDPLTGLANGTAFVERLRYEIARAVRDGSALTLLFSEVAGFADVAARHGGGAADELLKTLGARISGTLAPAYSAARLPGAAFGALCPGLGDPVEAAGLADRLRADVARPVAIGDTGVEVTLTVSLAVGAAGAAAADGGVRLIRQAELALA